MVEPAALAEASAGISPARRARHVAMGELGPVVSPGGVTFRYPDEPLRRVRLVQEVAWPRSGWGLTRSSSDGGWEVRLPRPPVDRMEYQFELVHEDGRSELTLDPGNPQSAMGAFGLKSVVEFPEYRPPSWTRADAPERIGSRRHLQIPTSLLESATRAVLWSPPDARSQDQLPLLVVHDGIEFAAFSQLLEMLDQLTNQRVLPPMRAALLHPVNRDEIYSASPVYARAMSEELMPFLATEAPFPAEPRFRVGLGASLGAVAVLHSHRSDPQLFGGVCLQSGSFFHARYDPHQLSSAHIDRVRRFVTQVHGEQRSDHPIPVTMSCGQVEMNVVNNVALSRALRRQQYRVEFRSVRDGHNWVAWRDAWDPALIQLLRRLWC